MLLVLLLTTIPPQIRSVWGARANAVSEVWAELGRSSVRVCAAVVLVLCKPNVLLRRAATVGTPTMYTLTRPS